jgi:hypothetical protein
VWSCLSHKLRVLLNRPDLFGILCTTSGAHSAGTGIKLSSSVGRALVHNVARPGLWHHGGPGANDSMVLSLAVEHYRTQDGKTNLEAFVRIVNLLGYLAVYRLTDPFNVMLPQRRSRYYMTMIIVSGSPIDQLAADFKMPDWAERLESIWDDISAPLVPWHRILMDDEVLSIASVWADGLAHPDRILGPRSEPPSSPPRTPGGVWQASSATVCGTRRGRRSDLQHLGHLQRR